MPMLGCTRLIDLKRLNREPEFAKTIVHEVNGVEYKLEPNSPKYICLFHSLYFVLILI